MDSHHYNFSDSDSCNMLDYLYRLENRSGLTEWIKTHPEELDAALTYATDLLDGVVMQSEIPFMNFALQLFIEQYRAVDLDTDRIAFLRVIRNRLYRRELEDLAEEIEAIAKSKE